jgi:hypothetical protein
VPIKRAYAHFIGPDLAWICWRKRRASSGTVTKSTHSGARIHAGQCQRAFHPVPSDPGAAPTRSFKFQAIRPGSWDAALGSRSQVSVP